MLHTSILPVIPAAASAIVPGSHAAGASPIESFTVVAAAVCAGSLLLWLVNKPLQPPPDGELDRFYEEYAEAA